MLAQNFKTPTELGITGKEFAAAVTVIGMLERGELTYTPNTAPIAKQCFNMAVTANEWYCGTVACFGGWMAIVMGYEDPQHYVYLAHSDSLTRLFWPGVIGLSEITLAQAAVAGRNFLRTGSPCWYEVLDQ